MAMAPTTLERAEVLVQDEHCKEDNPDGFEQHEKRRASGIPMTIAFIEEQNRHDRTRADEDSKEDPSHCIDGNVAVPEQPAR